MADADGDVAFVVEIHVANLGFGDQGVGAEGGEIDAPSQWVTDALGAADIAALGVAEPAAGAALDQHRAGAGGIADPAGPAAADQLVDQHGLVGLHPLPSRAAPARAAVREGVPAP